MLGILFGIALLAAIWIASRLFDRDGAVPGTAPRRAAPAPVSRARRDPYAGIRATEVVTDMPVVSDYDPNRDILSVQVDPPGHRQLLLSGNWLFDTLKVEERGGDTRVLVMGKPVLLVTGATDLSVGVRPAAAGDLYLDSDGVPVERETLDVILIETPPAEGSVPKHARRM